LFDQFIVCDCTCGIKIYLWYHKDSFVQALLISQSVSFRGNKSPGLADDYSAIAEYLHYNPEQFPIFFAARRPGVYANLPM